MIELTTKEAAAVRFAILMDIETLENMVEAKDAGRHEKRQLKLLNKALKKLDDVYPEAI